MADDWEDLDFDFGFSAVDADELGEIVSPSKTAEAVGKVEVQSNHVLERLDTIQTMLTLEVDARKKELEEKYKEENKQVFKGLEKMIIPLLKNLMKNPEKEYIYWPNRTDKIQKQIDKILEITRSTEVKQYINNTTTLEKRFQMPIIKIQKKYFASPNI